MQARAIELTMLANEGWKQRYSMEPSNKCCVQTSAGATAERLILNRCSKPLLKAAAQGSYTVTVKQCSREKKLHAPGPHSGDRVTWSCR